MYRSKRNLHSIKTCIAARYDLVDSVCRELESFMEDSGFEKAAFNIILGVREALINAVGHGAQENPLEEVCLIASLESDALVIKIKDSGEGFDWKKIIGTTGNRLSKHNNIIPERGRGINILLHYFDSVSFNQAGNEVEMHLLIDSRHPSR